MLTGVNAVGIGEASGMFPVDSSTMDYDAIMVEKFNNLAAEKGFQLNVRDILPNVLSAGTPAGQLTPRGTELERPLHRVYEEIDMVVTPTGRPVAMVHCNNCTGDMNAWVGVFGEILETVGADISTEDFLRCYTKKP